MASQRQWTDKEDETLKLLARKNKIKDWEKITLKLARYCQYPVRPSNQCRNRFLSLVDEEKKMKIENQWSFDELNLFQKLFIEHGLKWTLLAKNFQLRTENCLKNKFYNNLRKTAKRLMQSEMKKVRNCCKSTITCEMLTIILQLCYELSQASETFNIKIPQNPKLFEIRNKILEVSFSDKINETDDEVAYDLIKEVRKLNSNLRCFGVYKTKKRKSWNLNKKKFQSVLKIINWEDGQEKEVIKKPLNKKLKSNFNENQMDCQQRNRMYSQFEMQYYENPQAMLYWMNMGYFQQQMKIQAQWFQYNQCYQEYHYETSLIEKANCSPEVTKQQEMGFESENNIKFENLEGCLMDHEGSINMNAQNESVLINKAYQMKMEVCLKEQQII